MEESNRLERSEVWHNIYEVLARLDLKEVEGDCLDRPSAATEIEQAVKKLLPIHNVSVSLLERAATLVGNPATNISGSTDLACDEWQKDYERWRNER